jgi:hypothetical protein
MRLRIATVTGVISAGCRLLRTIVCRRESIAAVMSGIIVWIGASLLSPAAVMALHPSGSCDTFGVGVYGMDDTATIIGNANGTIPYGPYESPPLGTPTSRVHIRVRIGASISSPVSACYDPAPVPAGFYTDSPAIPATPYNPYSIWGVPGDANKISLSPPSSVVSGSVTLTYIGVTWENGSVAVFITNPRNFPTSGQVSASPGSRLIFHYVDCTNPDVIAGGYCPPPPPAVSCDSVFIEPDAVPEPNQPFRSRVTISNASGSADYSGASADLSVPGITTGPAPPPPYAVPTISGGSTGSVTSGNMTASAGSYTATWTISGGGVPTITCPKPFKVLHKPYFRVYGGDVLAGAPAFGDPCGYNDGSTIIGWNKGSSGSYGGAGTQLAAFAMAVINEFSSASARAGPGPPNGLSYANSSGTGTYGGNFDGPFCSLDYFAAAPSGPGVTVSSVDTAISAINIPPGTTRTYYVNGNVKIDGDITYDTTGWSFGNVPFFRVIATGNIFISPGVSQLSGLYIAKGSIYTCANGFSPPPIGTGFHDYCDDNKLTVNGAFIANKINFLRAVGTRYESLNSAEGPATTHIAEIFQFSPEMYMAPPATPDPDAPDYDSITSLPPVL